MHALRPAVVLLLVFTLLLGGIYPAVVLGVAQGAFRETANGSLLYNKEGQVIGSARLAQSFAGDKYFWPRPSISLPLYDGAGSMASNMSPGNPALVEEVKARVLALHMADKETSNPVPADLVEASASGLDPDISPQAADFQIKRVSAARKMDSDKLRALVHDHTQRRTFGILGQPRVNVLLLNLALDEATVTE